MNLTLKKRQQDLNFSDFRSYALQILFPSEILDLIPFFDWSQKGNKIQIFRTGIRSNIPIFSVVLGNFRSFPRNFSPYSSCFRSCSSEIKSDVQIFFRGFQYGIEKQSSFWGTLDLIPEESFFDWDQYTEKKTKYIWLEMKETYLNSKRAYWLVKFPNFLPWRTEFGIFLKWCFTTITTLKNLLTLSTTTENFIISITPLQSNMQRDACCRLHSTRLYCYELFFPVAFRSYYVENQLFLMFF